MLTTARDTTIEEYFRWNEAIGQVLFEGASAATPAYLHLEPHVLAEVAAAAGEGGADDAQASLVDAVRRTLRLERIGSPFAWHKNQVELWEDNGRRGYPPVLALLAVLVLAAQEMVADAEHAAHNYYGRLEQLLGLDGSNWRRVRYCFPDTVSLWITLNDWLDDWEGERGVPTAAILDRRVYISYPLSQALVRAADRGRLHDAFAEYGLAPGRRVAQAEMRDYLDDWFTHQAPGSRLGRLWGSADVRERIVEIARGELEAWTGFTAEQARSLGGTTQRLRWAAEARDGALPSLDLYLTARADGEATNGLYALVDPSDLPAREAVAGCEALSLEPLDGVEMASLEPWAAIGVASLLAGSLRIKRVAEPHTELVHSPHPLLVLAFDERDGWHREVSRAQLLEPCLVLAHKDRAAAVERHLRTHARPGFRKFEPQRLDGLPAGWIAFLDVAIVVPADEAQHKLVAPLCPAPANAIALAGGLRLGLNAWHVDAPPEVVITLEDRLAFKLAATCRRKLSPDAGDAELGEHDGLAAVPLAGVGLEAGDFDLGARDGRGNLLARASLRLRSADHPRPSAGERLSRRGHPLADPLGSLAARALESDEAAAVGGVIEGRPVAAAAPLLRLPPQPLMAAGERRASSSARPSRPDASQHQQSCATRGYHHWICDPAMAGEDHRTLKRMQCSGCQREEWTLNRGRLKRPKPSLRSAAAQRSEPPRMSKWARGHDSARPALDTLLDALSYAGAGSWDGLKQMALALSDDSLAGWEAARTLSGLGHVDILLDTRTFRLSGWQIAPACLVETADRTWVLAGARSDRLIDALEAALGGAADISDEGDGPTVIRTPPMSAAEASALAASLASPLGGPVMASPAFSERAAAAALPIAASLPRLELARMPSQGADRFDLATGGWRPAGDIPRAGAYRIDFHGRLYGFATADQARDGLMRVVDVLTAKHLAAAREAKSLAGYDRQSGMLAVPLGAELPGLLHRIAVLASGRTPQLHRSAGLVIYPAVPETVAAHLQRCLGIAS